MLFIAHDSPICFSVDGFRQRNPTDVIDDTACLHFYGISHLEDLDSSKRVYLSKGNLLL